MQAIHFDLPQLVMQQLFSYFHYKKSNLKSNLKEVKENNEENKLFLEPSKSSHSIIMISLLFRIFMCFNWFKS